MKPAAQVVDLVIGISPFGEPDARLAAAVSRTGALGVLDLGRGDRRSREALEQLGRWAQGPFGVRVGAHCRLRPADLAGDLAADLAGDLAGDLAAGGGSGPHTVVLGPDSPLSVRDLAPGHRVLVEVTSLDAALAAVRAGADGLIARGSECGGRVGELGTFVLLQQLLGEPGVTLPVWACGGIGPRTAAAAMVGGAAGVVLDTQLALLAESGLREEAAAALRAMDGSETTVLAGHRVLHRRGPDAVRIDADHGAGAGAGTETGAGAAARIGALLGAGDLRTQLLPVGQDGFLAVRFAERWGDVGRAVRAVRAAIRDAVRDDAATRTLRPGSPMSRALGTRLPIAQGPMTRVSDQAGFARAVADEGGLPFIALALAGREQAHAMLRETCAALAGRPWGVGVLGFAPEQTRSAQLEAVRELRPTHAIIAGGRPAQAEALESAGIRTFLHVPSPGLLRQFLDAGARRFVFEGAECGGHVGPRGSFPLWEAQLAVLEDYLDAAHADPTSQRIGAQRVGAQRVGAQVEVLLAGGIHDERSAAMVAALTSALTARGAAVGVLMGTAYLFTEEAVGHGAVQPLFQRQVLAARGTALLETAPGHATRCVPSPYSDGFRAAKDELRAAGASDRQVWEQLERRNVGRLRIASKGVERAGGDGELRPVGEDRQLGEGMFMAGEVAVLRSATTTIGALHRSVAPAAADFFAQRAAALGQRLGLAQAAEEHAEPPVPAPLDIAVVGMACMFPQAPDLATFWANVLNGTDAITEVPAERWDPAVFYAPEGNGAGEGTTTSKWGGFLPPIPFDPLRYGIPPASLGSIEPVQLLALEAARRALDDAGYGADAGREFDRTRTSVVFGAEAGSDLSNASALRTVLRAYYADLPGGLDEQLPVLTEDSFPGMLANVISGRIANRLDFGGANYTVDAACASSLAAVDVACKELVGGSSDLVLCGGADLHNGIHDYVLFSSVHALSPTGRSRTFDSAADGTALGEGVACVALKRLADAERDGDRIYGVIKGLGSSSDGRSLGLTAPRPEGQRAALERAYRNAHVSPAAVGLVEAHGTGTVVGDRTELTTLTRAFTEAGAQPGSCALGSVKSQIGHTKCAAGLAGLIKTVLALHTGVKPPTLHLTRPNAAWQAGTSPFAFHTEARPWAVPPAERVAGLSAFGFGGTNFHLVLAAHGRGAPPAHGLDAWPGELFLFRGADRAAADRAIEEVLGLVSAGGAGGRPWRLRDLALTACRRSDSRHEPVQVALVATGLDGLRVQLRRALAGEHDPGAGIHTADAASPAGDGAAGKVAFLFPGQGSQRPGMFAEAFVAFPDLQRYLELGRGHAGVLFPPAAFDDAGKAEQRARITDTRVAQPALGIVGLAAYDLLTRAGVQPDMAAGHSYGELVALCAAGALSPRDLVALSAERAQAILDAAGEDPGTMAAVSAGAEDVERALREAGLADRVVTANRNAPRQTVISGPTDDIDSAVRLLREAGYGARRIPVACAFHSPVVAGAGARFAEALASRPLRPPEFPVWANRTAAGYGGAPEEVRAELAAQIGAPVRFGEQIEAMYEAGARIFIEAGSGAVLTRLVSAVLGERPHRAVACETARSSGLPGFLDALAQLAVAGLPVRTGWMFRGRDAVDIGRAEPPRQPGWTVDGQLVRTADGDLLPGALAPARRVVEATVTEGNRASGGHADPGALISEFLRTSREMVAAQRDVLLTYIGAPGGADGTRLAQLPAMAPLPHPQRVPGELPPGPSPAAARTRPEPASAEAVVSEAASGGVSGAVSEADVLRAVSEIISERTGYPIDMIEPGLDLEADLSIDSIKRAEIAGELARRLGLGGGMDTAGLGDAELEELSKARTAAAVSGWLVERLAAAESPAESPADSPPGSPPGSPADPLPEPSIAPPAPPAPEAAAVTGTAPKRFELRTVPLERDAAPADPSSELSGNRFVLLGGGGSGAAEAVAALLDGLGAEARALDAGHQLTEQEGPVDGVLYLEPLDVSESPVLPDAFPVLQAALRLGPRWLLAARPAAATAGAAGLHGLFRTVAREYPDTVATAVDLHPELAGSATAVAEALLAELIAPDRAPVVVRTASGRARPELVESGLGTLGARGAGPAGDGAAEAAAIGLDRESVVLLVGGARGITARFAATLAGAARCRIELLGRTPAPSAPEDPATAAAGDRAALCAALAAQGGGRSPAEINRIAGLILAQREVAATLEELRTLGSQARYRCADVRDGEAVRQALKEIRAEYGRLDGVVYAAGVLEDRLIAEKAPASFQRVFGTKVSGAKSLLDALEEAPDGPRFTVLFGSVSAVLGNRGQADYAAANDALQCLAEQWTSRTGHRALTVHWGPWAPTGIHTGMVTAELGRDYARRGIELIDPEEGALALLRELAWGDETCGTVVYTASAR